MPEQNAGAAHVPAESRWFVEPSMALLDAWWDQRACLVKAPNYNQHDTRATLYYAIGLLKRSRAGDHERALEAIDKVLTYQWNAPGTAWHGTFARHPEEFTSGDQKTVWRDFDPNWREFIACALALILDLFAEDLTPLVAGKAKAAIVRAVEGAVERKVSPAYTNVALLTAFIVDYAYSMFPKEDWGDFADSLVEGITELYGQTGSFMEFNSPTYYGVDLCAVTQCRRFGRTGAVRVLGAMFETILWDELAIFYNPRLRNVCGPWLRSYGMDMARYCAVSGFWFGIVLPRDKAPLPDFSAEFEHTHDAAFGPYIDALGAQPPSGARLQIETADTKRLVRRALTPDGSWSVSALIEDTYMIGTLSSSGQFDPKRQPQAFPFVAHWTGPKGETGWIRAVPGACVDAKVKADGVVEMTWQSAKSAGEVAVGFEVCSPPQLTRFTAGSWRLPGLQVTVETSMPLEWLAPNDVGMTLSYKPSGATQSMILRFAPASASAQPALPAFKLPVPKSIS